MQRFSWRELDRKLPYWRVVMPWNCISGFGFFVVLFGNLLASLHVPLNMVKAIGLAFGILAFRQIGLSRSPTASAGRRHTIACFQLAFGYVLLSFLCFVDPARLRFLDWFYWVMLVGGVISCIGGLIVGRGTISPACSVPSPAQNVKNT